jgi:HAD superfamily hydrolase (TIGR01509 family)
MSPLPRAILFDMDGTLTAPMLDFPRIKREMGIGTQPILEALAQMSPDDRAQAEVILLRHEERAAMESTLNHGCDDVLGWLRERPLPTALITRNSRVSVSTVLARHRLSFDVLVTREDGRFKPDPEPLLLACRTLGVAPADAWMVGDGQYDVEAGLAAGVPTVWVSHGKEPTFAAKLWRVIRDLRELRTMLADSGAAR